MTPENPFEKRESTDTHRTWNTHSSPLSSVEKSELPYNYHKSRLSLFQTGFSRFFVTFLFCALMSSSQKLRRVPTTKILSNHVVRIFNSIMLALSLGLGLNIASSLKKICCNPTVVTIDSKICNSTYVRFNRRMRNSRGDIRADGPPHTRNASLPLLRSLSWFRDSKREGSRLTWAICMLWLLVNIRAQILVAALSLF